MVKKLLAISSTDGAYQRAAGSVLIELRRIVNALRGQDEILDYEEELAWSEYLANVRSVPRAWYETAEAFEWSRLCDTLASIQQRRSHLRRLHNWR